MPSQNIDELKGGFSYQEAALLLQESLPDNQPAEIEHAGEAHNRIPEIAEFLLRLMSASGLNSDMQAKLLSDRRIGEALSQHLQVYIYNSSARQRPEPAESLAVFLDKFTEILISYLEEQRNMEVLAASDMTSDRVGTLLGAGNGNPLQPS